MKNTEDTIPIIVRIVTAVLVIFFTVLFTIYLALYTYGFGYNFNPQNPVSYLIILPGLIISILASYLLPADLKVTLLQGFVWAAPLLIIQGGFKGLLDPANYLIPSGVIAGALLGFVFNKKISKEKNNIVIALIIITVLGAGLPIFLVYQYKSLSPITWAEIENRTPDMMTIEMLGASEENGNLVISVMGDLKGKTVYTKDEETVYTKATVIVDANTKIYKLMSMGYVKASEEELLKAEHLSIWFSSGSEVDSSSFKGNAESIVIE
jgi:nitrogen regulatory protein PII-like uncharacterized protein